MNPLDFFSGWKTYIAGIGLIGLGLYQASQGLYQEGLASIVAGIGLMTGRRAVERLAR